MIRFKWKDAADGAIAFIWWSNGVDAKNMPHHAIISSTNQFKEAIWHRCIVLSNLSRNLPTHVNAYDTLKLLVEAYDSHYRFQKDNIYYEAKLSPVAHRKAFYQVVLPYERRKIRLFKCLHFMLLGPMLCSNRFQNPLAKTFSTDDGSIVATNRIFRNLFGFGQQRIQSRRKRSPSFTWYHANVWRPWLNP